MKSPSLSSEPSLLFERIVLAVVAAIIAVYSAAIWALFNARDLIGAALVEGGPLETLGYICCFLAAGFLFAAFARGRSDAGLLKGRRNYWLLALGAAFLFLGLEEISWGQHLIGFQPPEDVAALNLQGEMNLHNMPALHFVVHYAGLTVLAAYFVFLPLINAASRDVRSVLAAISLPVPTLGIAAIYATALIGYHLPFYWFYLNSVGPELNHGEMQEAFYQVAAMLCAVQFLQRTVPVANHQDSPEEAPMDRTATLRSLVDTTGFGLEIGPSHAPIFPKSDGFRIEILDHASQKDLQAKYTALGVDSSRIEAVDYVSDGRRMVKVIGETGRYDYIFASHVIEHAPDLAGFLIDCEQLLKPSGALVLAVPDRRFCFDVFRPASTLGQVIHAHMEGRTRHTPATHFDEIALAVTREGHAGWQKAQIGSFSEIRSPTLAMAEVNKCLADPHYSDRHGWQFMPSTFRYIIKGLAELGMISLREARFVETPGFEFYVVMTRSAEGTKASYEELLFAAIQEAREVILPGEA